MGVYGNGGCMSIMNPPLNVYLLDTKAHLFYKFYSYSQNNVPNGIDRFEDSLQQSAGNLQTDLSKLAGTHGREPVGECQS